MKRGIVINDEPNDCNERIIYSHYHVKKHEVKQIATISPLTPPLFTINEIELFVGDEVLIQVKESSEQIDAYVSNSTNGGEIVFCATKSCKLFSHKPDEIIIVEKYNGNMRFDDSIFFNIYEECVKAIKDYHHLLESMKEPMQISSLCSLFEKLANKSGNHEEISMTTLENMKHVKEANDFQMMLKLYAEQAEHNKVYGACKLSRLHLLIVLTKAQFIEKQITSIESQYF